MCSSVHGLCLIMAGQLIERGKNTWLVRVYLGRDAHGKRQYLSKTIHGTKKQAQTWLNKTLTDRDAGVAVKPAQQTLGEYLDHWLESAAKPRVRPKTFAGYSDMLNRHIRPTLGLRPLSKLTPLEIQRAFHAMAERGLSPRSIEYTRMILKQALKQAVSWRLLVFNPCEGVQIPRQERREMQALTPDQARKFLAIVRGTQYGALFELALTTGLRPSEYCALKWEDIDFERGTLSVVRSIDFQPGGGWLLEETKTKGSRRVVRMLPSVLHALASHRLQQQECRQESGEDWRDEGFVFTNEKGSPLDRVKFCPSFSTPGSRPHEYPPFFKSSTAYATRADLSMPSQMTFTLRSCHWGDSTKESSGKALFCNTSAVRTSRSIMQASAERSDGSAR